MSRTETALGLEQRRGPLAWAVKLALYAIVVFVFAGPLVALLLSSFNRVGDASRFTILADLPVLHVDLIGSLWGMIIPVGAWAVSIVVMTEFMKEIPIELEEAARIDGAGELRVFGSVILPLCRPALGIIGILGFAMIWDQYMLPLLVAKDYHQYTLPLALRTLRTD